MADARAKADRLHWIKYNPTEWNGMYPELSDVEYGLFHRVIAKLWSTPGNRLTKEQLLADLRVKPGSERAELLQGLIGYALKVSEDDELHVQAIDEAFADAVKRSNAGAAGARARYGKVEQQGGLPSSAEPADPGDF